MSRSAPHKTTDISRFSGLDNVNESYEVGTKRLKTSLNVDFTRSNKVRRRKGQVLVTANAYVAVASDDGVVLALDSNGDVHQLDSSFAVAATYTELSGFGPHAKIRINKLLDFTIYSNGSAVGLCNHTTAQTVAFDETAYGDRTFDYSIPLPFNDVETFAGRNYYATRNYLYFSPVFGYYKLRLGKDYFRFPDTVTMVAKVDSGLFVGTLEKTYFLGSREPGKMKLEVVANVGVIEGTKTYAEGSIVGEGESTDALPIWATSSGFCVGLPNGKVNRVTQKYVTLPQGSIGSTMFRHQGGQNHIVSVIQT